MPAAVIPYRAPRSKVEFCIAAKSIYNNIYHNETIRAAKAAGFGLVSFSVSTDFDTLPFDTSAADSYNGFNGESRKRSFIINDKLIFVSYHNIDIQYVFQLSTLLIRYYRNIWLDRFEISPIEDWDERISHARGRASGAVVIVSDDYLQSDYCRSEYEYFQNQDIPITAVIPRDFSTDMISGFTFDDWIDFRRWFSAPNDHSVENLLARIPQSESVQQTGERLDYLRNFIQTLELQLSRMPTSRASLHGSRGQDSPSLRPRAYQSSLLRRWDFSNPKPKAALDVEDLLSWAKEQPQFILRGQIGSGKTTFARLLALEAAHAAMRDASAPLPIWLDLMKWEERYDSAETYIESQWGLVSYWKHWLENKQAWFVLDDWNDLAALHPDHAIELVDWIAANRQHRFILLSTDATSADPGLPILQITPMSGQLALNFSSSFLTLEQQSAFRQIIRNHQSRIENNHVDYLSIGIELLIYDKRLAVSEWHKNPLPALLSWRHRQMQRTAGAAPERGKLLKGLQTLAGHMMYGRFIPRGDAGEMIDAQVIDSALDIGLLSEVGSRLRFESEMFQWHLAADCLKQDGLDKYLVQPEFTASGGRIPQKWDNPAHTLVDTAAEENRLRIINQIAETDPFLANMCLQRHPDLYDPIQEALVAKLVEFSAQNPASHPAFRAALHAIPNPHKTVEALAGQLACFEDESRLWLWHELLALPIHLPAEFVNSVANIHRESSPAAADLLSDVSLPLSAAYLVKLSRQPNEPIRSNAIWLLGEIQYPPAAIFLLDGLEGGQADHPDEIVRALMKCANSGIFAGLLRWLQDHPAHTGQVTAAMNQRRHYVSGRLLSMAHEGRLTLNPQMADIMANNDEAEIAIGTALIASQFIDLPESLNQAIAAKDNADQLQRQVAAGIRHLPDREGFQQLLDDIAQVIQAPPETIARSDSSSETQTVPTFSDDCAVDPQFAPAPLAEDTPAKPLEQPHDGSRSPAMDEDPLDDDTQAAIPDDATDERPAVAAEKSGKTFTDEEKLLRTLELLRHDSWGKTQKAAKFLRQFAKHLRGAANPNIIRLLCNALSDTSWHVRWAVAEALAWMHHPDAIPYLKDRLDDANWIVQVAVIRALVELDAKESAAAMTHLLQSPHKAVREATAEALGTLQNPDAIPALGQTLKQDPDYFVRFAAIQSIHQISPSEAREYLDYALTDRYIHVRWYAMKALAPLMDASDIPVLARMTGDKGKPLWEEKSIRDFAILALQRINTPESKTLLEHIRKAEKRNDS